MVVEWLVAVECRLFGRVVAVLAETVRQQAVVLDCDVDDAPSMGCFYDLYRLQALSGPNMNLRLVRRLS